MHFISMLFLLLLSGVASAETIVYYNPPLNSNFTMLDNFNNGILSVGTEGPLKGLVVVNPDKPHRFLWEHLIERVSIIRDSESHRWIHFQEIKDGAVATLSDKAATVLKQQIYDDSVYVVFADYEYPPSQEPLVLTVEPYSSTDSRLVVKLREWGFDGSNLRQNFVFVKAPLHEN